MCFAPQQRALFRDLNFQKWSENGAFCTFWLRNALRATTPCTFSTSQLPKVLCPWCVLYILTSKCASRRNAVHFFDISTSKTAPNPSVFNTFYILLPNVLRATTPCTFSTSQLPKVVRSWGVLYIFTSKSASRHNGMQLFISHLPRYLRTRRFSEPTFQPSGATKPRKKHFVSRLSYLFAHLHLLSSDLFSSDSSPCWLLFHLSILSLVWLLNFLRLLQVQLQLQLQINYDTLHYLITLRYTTLITSNYATHHHANYTTTTTITTTTATTTISTTPHYTTLHWINYIAARYHYKCTCNYNCTTLHNTMLHYTNYNYAATTTTTTTTTTRMPAVSPPPEGSTTDFPFFFLEICFSLWFRSDALSVSPEPELQIHCVFQGFLFLFSNVLFFSLESRFSCF